MINYKKEIEGLKDFKVGDVVNIIYNKEHFDYSGTGFGLECELVAKLEYYNPFTIFDVFQNGKWNGYRLKTTNSLVKIKDINIYFVNVGGVYLSTVVFPYWMMEYADNNSDMVVDIEEFI